MTEPFAFVKRSTLSLLKNAQPSKVTLYICNWDGTYTQKRPSDIQAYLKNGEMRASPNLLFQPMVSPATAKEPTFCLHCNTKRTWDIFVFTWLMSYVAAAPAARVSYACVCICLCVHTPLHNFFLVLLWIATPSVPRRELDDKSTWSTHTHTHTHTYTHTHIHTYNSFLSLSERGSVLDG